MTVRSTYFPMLLSFVAAFAPPPAAWALPLAPEACERARGEQTELSSKGVAIDVAKGGEWGRANLDRARLAQVARWIELEEQNSLPLPASPDRSQGSTWVGRHQDEGDGRGGQAQAQGSREIHAQRG